MAVDKKSDYVGNHGGAYTDLEGQRKQFTYIDHDPKTTIGAKVISPEEGMQARDDVKKYKEYIINKILSIPPSVCPEIFHDFTKRGEEGISWNTNMIKDDGMPIDKLRDLLTLLENKIVIERIII